jgi:hypothetical protein
MDGILINVLTRCSRPNDVGFGRTLTSVKEQGVDVNWFISYETQEIYEYLKKQDLPKNTTLVKVPKYNIIPNLGITYEHHDAYTDYTKWDWEKWQVTSYIGEEPETKTIELSPIRYEKDGFWCETLKDSTKKHVTHFPVNLYLKILEAQVQEGWIIHLDDGTMFESSDSLKKLQEEISKHDEDTLHIFKLMNMGRYWTTPQPIPWKYYQTGHPMIHGECSGSCLCFNVKWKNYTAWDEWRFADYRTARCLESVIPKRNLFDLVVIWTPDPNRTLELQRKEDVTPYEFNS